jgi:hypothetical protein
MDNKNHRGERFYISRNVLMGRNVGYTHLYHKRNEEMIKEVQIPQITACVEPYGRT